MDRSDLMYWVFCSQTLSFSIFFKRFLLVSWFRKRHVPLNARGCSLQKILVHPNIRIPFLGVNNSSNSVFKSCFIHKILIHPKKSGKKSEKSKKSEKNNKDFWGNKIRTLGVNNPSLKWWVASVPLELDWYSIKIIETEIHEFIYSNLLI